MPGDENLPGRVGEDHRRPDLVTLGTDVELWIVGHSLFVDAGVAGMGHVKIVVHAAHQHLLPVHHPVAVDPRELLRQHILVDPMVVVQSGLGSPAQMHRREHVGLGPFEDGFHFRPVLDLFKIHFFNRGPGDDQPVEILVLQIRKGFVEFIEMGGLRVLRFPGFGLHQRDLRLDRKVGQHPQQVQLGRFLQRHQIQDTDAERPNLLGVRPAFVHHKNVFPFENLFCRQIILN